MIKSQSELKISMILGAIQENGKEFAYSLAKAGYDLILVDKHEEELLQLKKLIKKEHKVKIRLIVEDLGKPESAENVMEAFLLYSYFSEQPITIDVLVNNTSVPKSEKEVLDIWDKADELTPIHPATLVDMTDSIGRDMAKKGNGKIFTIMQMDDISLDSIRKIHQSTQQFLQDFSANAASRFSESGVSVCVLFPTESHQIPPLLHTLL